MHKYYICINVYWLLENIDFTEYMIIKLIYLS